MRFPSYTELDADQKAAFSGLTEEKRAVLVAGPPGTGKTILAFYRAKVLADKGRRPQLIMFNKVLSKYANTQSDSSRSAGIDGVAGVTTMHKWVHQWWRDGCLKGNPPADKYEHNWPAILRGVVGKYQQNGSPITRLHWGELIVDEGQDFPRLMYQVLNMLSTMTHLWGEVGPPTLCVFADENQRLQPEGNSTIEQIRTELAIADGDSKRYFYLKKNYRNTFQIASFAKHFYCGLRTGIPDLPDRRGDQPVVSLNPGLDGFMLRVSRYVRGASGKDICVICAKNSVRSKVFNRLTEKLKGTAVSVQTYASQSDEHPAERLVFDRGNMVTVLNYQSAKGLEFDAVFIAEPFELIDQAAIGADQFKMTMYVMCSRAREYLEVGFFNDSSLRNWNSLSSQLPRQELYELEDMRG